MYMNSIEYKKQFTFEKRSNESKDIINKYPDRIPIICERYGNNIDLLDKKKYLAPNNLTLGQFIIVLRKRLNITEEKAIFCFIKNKIPIISSDLATLYNEDKDEDGFLYIVYSGENCFGCNCFDIPCFNTNSFNVAVNRLCALKIFDVKPKKNDAPTSDASLNNIIIDNITTNNNDFDYVIDEYKISDDEISDFEII